MYLHSSISWNLQCSCESTNVSAQPTVNISALKNDVAYITAFQIRKLECFNATSLWSSRDVSRMKKLHPLITGNMDATTKYLISHFMAELFTATLLCGVLAHLICSDLRWKLRASTRTSSANGGLSFLRWRSKWAELERAWTPESVRLETDRDTGLSGFSLLTASCAQTERTPKR